MAGPSPVDQAIEAFERGDLAGARDIATEELRVRPSPPLQHLMGIMECRAGRLESGVEWFRRACGAEPQSVAFQVPLVRALVDLGRPGEALAIIPPDGTTAPELALWHARAEAAEAAEQWDKAAEAWGRLCSSGIRDWRAFSQYGHALARMGRWFPASKAFQAALELNPAEAPIRRSLAAALARAGRYDESADELRSWVEAMPGSPEVRIMLARLLADLGRDEEAMAELDHASRLATGRVASFESGAGLIEIAEDRARRGSIHLETLKELARLLERLNRIDALEKLIAEAESRGIKRGEIGYAAAAVALRAGDAAEAKRLLQCEPADHDPPRWHWLMSKIADSLGDSDLAFAEAEAMNRSAGDYAEWRRRAKVHVDWVRSLARLVEPNWSNRLKTLKPGARRSPAFLVGFPRSGTTLLDTFLMGHPDAAVLEELPMIQAVEAVLGRIESLPDLDEEQLLQGRRAYFAEVDRHLEPGFSGLVIDKRPLNMIATPYLHALFPDARMVFAQRHPCDAVLSCFMQNFALNDAMACFLAIDDAADFYDSAMEAWTAASETLGLNVRTLVYEELVVDPAAALRPLIEFLGLEWHRELIDHRATAIDRGAIATPSYLQVVQPLNADPVGRWRRYEKHLKPVLPTLLPWAQRLGYPN